MRIPAALIVLAAVLWGCAANEGQTATAPAPEASDRWHKTDEAVVNTLKQAVQESRHGPGVSHVVLMWLKKPGDAAAVDKIIQTSREFRQIPGVIDIKAGRPIPSTRPVVDSSYDVGLVMTFQDEAALQAYETHPQHVKGVKEVLRPLAAKIQVYDMKEADASSAPASKADTK